MRLRTAAWGAGLLGATAVSAAKAGLPVDKVYGVNLGSWLLSESWMFPEEWKAMGGEVCDDCSKCASTEYDLVKKLGQIEANKVFAKHWSTWFTQEHVNAIADANLNTVRIPLGYWIVEPLVNRTTEYYPQGGLIYLKKGLRMLKAKGIHVILDFHALPGVSSANQMFAGRCTTDVQFYTPANYKRALVWAAVMTAITHIDPDFSMVFSIEAINEPTQDASQTPGLGDYEKNFVEVVRSVEYALGIKCPNTDYSKLCPNSASADLGLLSVAKFAESAVASVLKEATDILPDVITSLGLSNLHLRRALGGLDNVGTPEGHGAGRGRLGAYGPVGGAEKRSEDVGEAVSHGSSLERFAARKRAHRRGISATLNKGAQRQCLSTSFMNKDWQWNNPANPADAAIGPQLYDAHLYFSFGGVADPNAQSYMEVICNTDRVTNAYAQGNNPLVFGEWSLATNFNASEQFIHDWADAQRYIYAGQADGWIFWNFKVETGSVYSPAWSYLDALDKGYFSQDPSKLTNPDVCVPYIKNATSTPA
ncbi:glycoside hydrolase [Ceratobasidium sp. AG-I]|nr:glycoside hydrolase [Ceratobasidium sp. AG-I]